MTSWRARISKDDHALLLLLVGLGISERKKNIFCGRRKKVIFDGIPEQKILFRKNYVGNFRKKKNIFCGRREKVIFDGIPDQKILFRKN
jgi:hypothetical protein